MACRGGCGFIATGGLADGGFALAGGGAFAGGGLTPGGSLPPVVTMTCGLPPGTAGGMTTTTGAFDGAVVETKPPAPEGGRDGWPGACDCVGVGPLGAPGCERVAGGGATVPPATPEPATTGPQSDAAPGAEEDAVGDA